jgi:phosphatidylinositol 4-kinase A
LRLRCKQSSTFNLQSSTIPLLARIASPHQCPHARESDLSNLLPPTLRNATQRNATHPLLSFGFIASRHCNNVAVIHNPATPFNRSILSSTPNCRNLAHSSLLHQSSRALALTTSCPESLILNTINNLDAALFSTIDCQRIIHRLNHLRCLVSLHLTQRYSLVHDVLGQETGDDRIPMEKVIMLMWSFRQDPTVVTFMARLVSKCAGSRHVFDGIEFYLPQLAHMIIHLEVEWDDAILERFALVIAQQSLHFALQLNWILQGALQDYQPQLEDGTPNPTYNPLFYTRCLKLLQNVERCVVYGRPRTMELQRLYEKGKISKKEMILMEQADRRFNALQITANNEDSTNPATIQLQGWLQIRMPGTKKWVYRYCELRINLLNVYKGHACCGTDAINSSETLELERAMALENATVYERYGKIIQIKTAVLNFALNMPNPEERHLWLRRLTEETETSALFTSHNQRLRSDLTPTQMDRYDFFHSERQFVDSLTALAEALRFKDRDDRKALAPKLMDRLEIQGRVYLPLCNSSDLWRRVMKVLPKETRVFNTKERCPVVMQFVTQRGERTTKGGLRLDANLDVAEYMHHCLEVNDEMELVAEEAENEETKEEEQGFEMEEYAPNDTNVHSNGKDDLRLSEHGSVSVSNVWMEEEEEPPTPAGRKGNQRVQRLMKESVALPQLLAKRLTIAKNRAEQSHRRISVMDRQTHIQPLVPILEGNRAQASQDDTENGSVGDGTVVSIERSSVMLSKDMILLGDREEGDITLECIDRAKKYVCGGESWAERTRRMLENTRNDLKGSEDEAQLEIVSCLAKSNDDLRQEVFVMQMIHYYKSVFASAKIPLWLRTYRILSTSSSTGLLELLTDATSIDGLKKSEGFPTEGGLRKYFEMVYGDPNSKSFKAAQRNFTQSLAAYALVSYLLGLKDRHNGNIMIDTRGHLIFIDFGFAMGMAPGHEFSMERAPFKFTKEYVDVMDGLGSECYAEFERLFVAGLLEARKNSQIALGLVEIMMFKSNYPCFTGSRYGNGKALTRFEKRLMLRVPDDKIKNKALGLIRKSRQHYGTYLYDKFQKATNGYAM